MTTINNPAYLQNLLDTKYVKPEGGTYTSKIQTKEEMKKKLKNYARVDDINDVPMNTHVRYVTLDKSKRQVFRTGGLLIRKEKKYIQLSNGSFKWSVQKYHYDEGNEEPIFSTVFFYRLSQKEEYKDREKKLIEEYEAREEKLIELIKRQHEEIKLLKSQLEE